MTIVPASATLKAVLAAYGISPVSIHRVDSGLINQTYHVTDDKGIVRILQAVNAMHPPATNLDIDLVTRHLENAGLLTPRLLPDRQGQVFRQQDDQVWRVFSHIEGKVHSRLEQPDMAGAAGRMLGRVHAALALIDIKLRSERPASHDLPRHARHLAETLERRRDHARFTAVRPLAETLLAQLDALPTLPPVAPRLVHGDPKISNFIFADDGHEAHCMVDFDTLNKMPVYLEIGDALRSWCNPAGEDTAAGVFAMAPCRAALDGYARTAGALLTEEEWQGIPLATLTIHLELAARFCADALNEDYFSWDASNFASHSEHSETRARGQLSAADSLRQQLTVLEATVTEAFTRWKPRG